VEDAILNASAVILAPSNPVTSIGPILAVPAIRAALRETKASVAAISPIVGGSAVAGPADILMASQGLDVSIGGVAQAYRDFLDLLIVDSKDEQAAAELRKSGLRVETAQTLMRSTQDKADLAKRTLDLLAEPRTRAHSS
jgi:LPPG:FO 2-phospho-L-lactate transferase